MLSLNKYLKTSKLLIVVCLFLFKNSGAQNLINNGNFENYTEDLGTSHCVTNFSSMFNWQQISSPDVYVKSCTFVNHYGAPNNTFGVAYPKNGNAYIGIASFYKTLEVKEYIYQFLNIPLTVGKSYYVSFYISLADRTGYAIKNIGAYLSITQPSAASSNTWIPANPQIINQTGYLTDTVGWSKIEGYFTAQGGEQYITIGNFNSNANTDTLYTGTTNPIPFDNGMSYYYIDSVSLYDSLDYITNIKQIENNIKVNVYPNPISSILNIVDENNQLQNATIQIQNNLGQLVFTSPFNNQINLHNLSSGMYFLTIQDKRSKKTVKIIKQ